MPSSFLSRAFAGGHHFHAALEAHGLGSVEPDALGALRTASRELRQVGDLLERNSLFKALDRAWGEIKSGAKPEPRNDTRVGEEDPIRTKGRAITARCATPSEVYRPSCSWGDVGACEKDAPVEGEENMTYVDGFIAAVPTANRDKYRKHAEAHPSCSRNTAR